MKRFLKPFMLAVVTLALGFALLRPSGIEETVVAIVSLSLIAVGPSLLNPSLPRQWSGLFIGLLLSLPVAAVFHYWLWLLPMTAGGWCVGLASQNIGEPSRAKSRGITLAFLLSLIALVATVLTVRTQQNRTLAQFSSNGIEYSQTYLGRPNTCQIVVKIESRTYQVGDEKSDGLRNAVKSLRKRIASLLHAGTSPSEISIICEASNQRDKNRVWLLREAFDNVDGRELHVSFRAPTTKQD